MPRSPLPSSAARDVPRGALVPEDGTFAVAGVHRGIVNLNARDEYGEYLISVISDSEDWTELAILVSPDDPWWGQHRSIGDRISLGEIVSEPAPPRRTGLDAPHIPPAVVRETAATLLQQHRDSGFVALLASEPPQHDPFVRRAAALLREAPDSGVSSVSVLIGLGIGFTPAGDDFVSGVILAEMMLSGSLPSAADRAAVRTRLHSTTAGGASLLRVASAGFPPAYHMEMVEALATGRMAAALAIARSHGHSSGLDTLSGLLWRLLPSESPSGSDIFDKQRRRV